MNSDRCYHVPTSPGQSMCTCEDKRMWLELLVAMQAEHIDTLTKRLEKGKVKIMDFEVHDHRTPDNPIIPKHYGGREDPYEVFKVIRAWEVNFFLGNALKYIRRAGKKDPSKHIEDLEKAKEYIQAEIDHLKAEAAPQYDFSHLSRSS